MKEPLDLDILPIPAPARKTRAGRRGSHATFGDFRCLSCRSPVSSQSWLSGVQNRNHCPYCLWSRHLDLYRAGDRLSACRAGMEPIGLTLKRSSKHYPAAFGGELMLIHRCQDCGKISINRIAADDDPQAILEVFETSLKLDAEVQLEIHSRGILLLSEADQAILHARLFGKEAAVC